MIIDLNTKMDKNQLQLFQNTYFGYFLDIHPFVIQGKLLHILLMWIVDKPSKTTLFFDINGQEIRFSIIEFATIIGLKFYEDIISIFCNSNVYGILLKNFFQDKDRVSMEVIKNVFNNYSDDSTDKVIKLGILYLLTNFYLLESTKKTIESW